MVEQHRTRPALPVWVPDQPHLPGTRAEVDGAHLRQGRRAGGHGRAQLPGERGHDLLDREKPPTTAQLVRDLRIDPAPRCRRSSCHRVLHRR